MKKLFIMLFLACLASGVQAQDEKVMEQRAREMFRVISLNDPAEWKKFIKENYTKALIDKPMRAQVDGGASASSNSSQSHEGNIEGKAKMYQMLHNDFGGGKVQSIKKTGDKLDMAVQNGGMSGTFSLRFSKEKPYLIDGLGVEVGN